MSIFVAWIVGAVGERRFRRAVLRFLGQIADGDGLGVVEDRLGDALDVFRRDGLQLRQDVVGGLRVLVEDDRAREFVGAAVGGFAVLQRRGDQLVAGFVEFGRGDRRVAHLRDFGLQRGDAVVRRLAVAEDGVERIDAGMVVDVEVGADLGGELLLVDQRLVEPRGLAARHDGVEQHQRRQCPGFRPPGCGQDIRTAGSGTLGS